MKQNILRIFYFCLICFFLIAGFLSLKFLPKSHFQIPLFYPSITPIQPTTAHNVTAISKVIRVIDGDTIEIEGKKVVRYIGIDTPETKHPIKGVECFGIEAADFNKKLVEGKYIRMQKDVSETDQYKRLLRYVWLVDSPIATNEGIFVNDYLAREGYAYAATFPPDVKYSKQFVEAQKEARVENKGLWSKCKN